MHDPATCHYCKMTRAAVAADPSIRPRGSCPGSIDCPDCHAPAGSPCKRPSEHGARAMHSDRYRAVERADAMACVGFEPYPTPHGVGCAHCSGTPEDHPGAAAAAAPATRRGRRTVATSPDVPTLF